MFDRTCDCRTVNAQPGAAAERFPRTDAKTRLLRASGAAREGRVRRAAGGQGAAAAAVDATTARSQTAHAAAVHQTSGVLPAGTLPAVPVPGGPVPAAPVSRAAVPDQRRVRAHRPATIVGRAHHRDAARHVPANVLDSQGPRALQDHTAIDSAHHRAITAAAAAATAVLERQRAGAVRGLLGTLGRISSGAQGQGAHPRRRLHRMPGHGQFPASVLVPKVHIVRQDGIRSAVRMGVHVSEGIVVRPRRRHLQLVVRAGVQ